MINQQCSGLCSYCDVILRSQNRSSLIRSIFGLFPGDDVDGKFSMLHNKAEISLPKAVSIH